MRNDIGSTVAVVLIAAAAMAAGVRGCLARIRPPGGVVRIGPDRRVVSGARGLPRPAGGEGTHRKAEDSSEDGCPPAEGRARVMAERWRLTTTRRGSVPGHASPVGSAGPGASPRGPGRRALAAGAAVGVAVVALLAAGAAPAAAHPLGNFTVNRYDGLVVGEHELKVDHVEDLAEIPTARIRPERFPAGGLSAWAKERCSSAAGEARLSVDGRPVALAVGAARAEIRPGQAGLPTLRVECALKAPLQSETVRVGFGAGGGDRAGWREITARGDGTTLTSSDVPEDSVSR
ncbi:hypothetical protein ACWGI8_31875, partial [Streptomyces sp. NPDC054841]